MMLDFVHTAYSKSKQMEEKNQKMCKDRARTFPRSNCLINWRRNIDWWEFLTFFFPFRKRVREHCRDLPVQLPLVTHSNKSKFGKSTTVKPEGIPNSNRLEADCWSSIVSASGKTNFRFRDVFSVGTLTAIKKEAKMLRT